MTKFASSLLLALVLVRSAVAAVPQSEPELIRLTYHSEKMNAERDYFVYLPRGFGQQKAWPVIMFLHGTGERGDGKAELDYVLTHGPIFEAWAQKRDLPFVIISPQLPIYDQGEIPYIKTRTLAVVPRRLAAGINPYPAHYTGKDVMQGQLSEDFPPTLADYGQNSSDWCTMADEVMGLLDHVLANYKGDPKRVYLTGLSAGGKGTWYVAAKHPEKFAAIAPVVGSASVALAPALAEAKLPIWVFAGGRDVTDNKVKYFYPLLNKLEELGHLDVRFTIEADMGHNAWIRVYASQDLYTWFLSHSR